MNRFILMTLMVFFAATCLGQSMDTVVTVSERFHYIYLRPDQTKEQIQQDNEERQRNWQEELEQMRAGLVSDNVKIEVQTEVQGDNLVVSVAYETLVVADAADDYALGKYTIQNSNACQLMCNFLKSKLEGDLAELLKDGTKVDVRITGATDGTPIRSKIDYKGEYGDFTDQPITLNGQPYRMTVTQRTGITTNGQLAFLRTQGVEDFLKHQVATLQHTANMFEAFAVENKEKGGGYRRVSVEIVIHDAFQHVEPHNAGQP